MIKGLNRIFDYDFLKMLIKNYSAFDMLEHITLSDARKKYNAVCRVVDKKRLTVVEHKITNL